MSEKEKNGQEEDLDVTFGGKQEYRHDVKEPLEPGKFLGTNYRLKKKLGEGSMGIAWLAEEIIDGEVIREAAVKIVPLEVQKDPSAMQQVRKTYDLVKDLSGLGICPIYGLNKDADYGWFLVMQYVNGPSLRTVLDTRPTGKFTPTETIKILMNIARGLDRAHKQKVLHRDVKPANIMFNKSRSGYDEAVLIDFGLASEIHTSMTHLSRTKTSYAGTPLYMSPEQWRNKKLDGRADQFALGVIAYEMLSGNRPFDGPTSEIVYLQVMNEEIEDLPDFSKSLNLVLKKATSKKKENRYKNCTTFILALASSINDTTNNKSPHETSDLPSEQDTTKKPAAIEPLKFISAKKNGFFEITV